MTKVWYKGESRNTDIHKNEDHTDPVLKCFTSICEVFIRFICIAPQAISQKFHQDPVRWVLLSLHFKDKGIEA